MKAIGGQEVVLYVTVAFEEKYIPSKGNTGLYEKIDQWVAFATNKAPTRMITQNDITGVSANKDRRQAIVEAVDKWFEGIE